MYAGAQPEDIVRFLVEKSVLTLADVLDGGVSVVEAQGRNNPLLIRCGDRTILYKAPDAVRPSSRPLLENEAHAIRILERDGSLAGSIPTIISLDDSAAIRVYTTASGYQPFAELVVDTRTVVPNGLFDMVRRQGNILRCLHRTWDSAFARNLPWVLQMEAPPLAMYPYSNAAAREVISIVQQSDSLSAGLKRARKDWRPSALGHGDARWENWLTNPETGGQIIIDFETFGCMDPRWDIAAYIAEPLRRWALSDNPREGEKWVFLAHSMVPQLLQGYNNEPTPLDVETVAYCAAWIIQRVYESAQAQSGISSQSMRALQLAEGIMSDPNSVLHDIFQ
ncbi:phosphotransferase [Bradyrhizobium sp. SZCCHNS3002]|uniref:phosphotransferase n=1 Tax=Bradyrhizobium sp. SZCCHNS3002 TaxID=3057310 RepID=UPI0028E3701F|nr:phosphotransferase [Bradyrhizobium sp. SZCCHNS3002]